MTIKLITLENSEIEVNILRQKFTGSPLEVVSLLEEVSTQIDSRIEGADSFGFGSDSRFVERLVRQKSTINKTIKKLHKTYR